MVIVGKNKFWILDEIKKLQIDVYKILLKLNICNPINSNWFSKVVVVIK